MGLCVPLFCYIVFKESLSNYLNILNWTSAVVSFASLFLAVFSAVLSSKESKKSMETLEKVNSIQLDSANNLLEIKKLAENIVHFNEGTMVHLINAFITDHNGDPSIKGWKPDKTL